MDPISIWEEPWDVNRRLNELGLTEDVLRQSIMRAQAAWAQCTPHHPRPFAAIVTWGEGMCALRDLLIPRGWSCADDRGLPLAVNPQGTLAITIQSGDENTGRVGQGQPRTSSGHGPATIDFVQQNAYLFPDMEAEARARFEQERQRAKNTWVLLLKRDSVLGQVRCELSHPTAMDEENRIVGWSERIILPPVEFDPTPDIAADDGGPDDGEITIDIKRRA